MNKRIFKKIWNLLFVMMLSVMVFALSAAAAAQPGKVKKLKGSAAESKVTLKWSKLNSVTGYNIYSKDTDGTFKKIKTVKGASKTSYKLTDVRNGTTYEYYVTAYKTSKNVTTEGEKSNVVKVTPKAKDPGKVTVQSASNGDGKSSISWKKNKRATSYEVYQKNAAGQFEKISTVKGTSATITGLVNDKQYYFKVRAARTIRGGTTYGAFSNEIIGKPGVPKVDISSVHPIYYKAKMKQTLTLTSTDQSTTKTFKKGSKVIVDRRGSTSYIVEKGKLYSVASKNVSRYGMKWENKTLYNKETAEAYLNYKGYTSPSKVLLWINTYTQRMYYCTGSQYNWKVQYIWKVSTGSWSQGESYRGVTKIKSKHSVSWFGKYQMGKWVSKISWGGIHSELLYPSGAVYTSLGTLGNPASHGCVRINVNNAKYIYDHAPVGTTVVLW